MKAPANEAKKLARKELPPTARPPHPRKSSALVTDLAEQGAGNEHAEKEQGRICLAKPQDEENQSPSSPWSVLVNTDRPTNRRWRDRHRLAGQEQGQTSHRQRYKPDLPCAASELVITSIISPGPRQPGVSSQPAA